MKRSRESNYDLLRIICMTAVISAHVSDLYIKAVTNKELFGVFYTEHIGAICFYNVLPRFSVPCFVMLSGAFLLSEEKNAQYRYFYKKTFQSVGIPTILFSLFYFLFATAEAALSVYSNGRDRIRLLAPVTGWLRGEPFYHLWYLYMMAGVYLLVPFLVRIKKEMGERRFCRTAWAFLIPASLSAWTCSYTLKWNLGLSFCYLGYFMTGYAIRKWAASHKSGGKGIVLTGLGVGLELATVFFRYLQAGQGIADRDMEYLFTDPYFPLTTAASVLIFAGFSMMTLKRDYAKLSALTFLIYLFHAGVWDIGERLTVRALGPEADCRIVIPAGIAAVFFLSLLLSLAYRKLYRAADGKWKISDKLCRLVKLE